MSKFIKDLVKEIGDESASILMNAENTAELSGFIDTGSYIVNAVFSGSLYGGIPENKVTTLAGESTTGKTYFSLGLASAFMENHERAAVVYYDTESAVTKDMFESRGVNSENVMISEPITVQETKHKIYKLLEVFGQKKDPPRLMIIIDSIGNLSTVKEMTDLEAGANIKDMTRPSEMKAMIRTIGLKAAKLRVPIIMTNHIYMNIGGYGDPKVMGGGTGPKFLSDTVAMLTKRKAKDGKDITGNEIDVSMYKSRFSMENKKVSTLLDYKKGLSRYYGLLDLAEKYDIIKKVSTRYEMPDGSKHFGKSINADPEKFFTAEIMAELEKAAAKEFKYGSDID